MANEVTIVVNGKDNASGVFDGVKKSAGGLGSALGDVAKIAGGFAIGQGIASAPGFLLDAAKAASEDAASTERLKQTIINAGGSWDEYKGKVDAAIASGQKKGFTDDDVRDSLNFLTNATGDAAEANKRLAIAQDVARGANLPLATATKFLGKMNEENIQTFKKLGITIKDGSTEAEALAAVQGKFAGQSDAYAKSTAGQMAQANIAMSELKESIGYAVLPILAKLAALFNEKVLPVMQEWVAKIGPAVDAAIEWADNSEQLQFILSQLGDGLVVLGELVKAVTEFFAEHKTALIAVGVALGILLVAMFPVPVAILGLIFVIGLLSNKWDDIAAKTKEIWNAMPGPIKDAINLIVLIVVMQFELIKNYITTAFNVIRDIFTIVMALIHGDWGAAWEGIKQLGSDIWDGIITDISLKLGFVRDVVSLVLSFLVSVFQYAWSVIANVVSDRVEAVKGFISGIGDAIQGAISWIQKLIDKINSIPSPGDIVSGIGGLIPGHAAGIRNSIGGLAIVGENGPELVRLPRGADVFSNGESRAMARDASGRGGVQVSIGVVNARSEDEARQAASNVGYSIQQAMRSRGVAA